MEKEYLSESPAQTRKLGRNLTKEILRTKPKNGLIIGLEGDLGGGKTTFLQGFAKGLEIKEKILSPTFVILKKFKIAKTKDRWLYHIDCYRVGNVKEILELGFKKIISDPQNIVVIEWTNRIREILPKKIITVKFEFLDKTKRRIFVNS